MSSAYFTVFTRIKVSVETNEKIDILDKMTHLKETNSISNHITDNELTSNLTTERISLKIIIVDQGFIVANRGHSFTLASDIESKYYYDLRGMLMDPRSLDLMGKLIYEKVGHQKIDAVGGLETGAVSLSMAVAREGLKTHKTMRAFYVLKKPLGNGKWFEGNLEPGDNILIVDDVSTSGSSLLETIKKVREYGCNPIRAISVIDREQGAKEALEKIGVPFEGLFRHSEFSELLG